MSELFEELWGVTSRILDDSGYHRSELEALFDVIHGIESDVLLEVGVCYGRSASLLLQVAKLRKHSLILVDPYSDNPSPMQRAVLELYNIGYPFMLYMMQSRQVPTWAIPELGFVHIDGDHTAEGVRIDCEKWLPRLKSGGFVAAHDYGEPFGIPSVKETIDTFLGDWPRIAHVDRVGIWRKP